MRSSHIGCLGISEEQHKAKFSNLQCIPCKPRTSPISFTLKTLKKSSQHINGLVLNARSAAYVQKLEKRI